MHLRTGTIAGSELTIVTVNRICLAAKIDISDEYSVNGDKSLVEQGRLFDSFQHKISF